jgi:hypothetical protein
MIIGMFGVRKKVGGWEVGIYKTNLKDCRVQLTDVLEH